MFLGNGKPKAPTAQLVSIIAALIASAGCSNQVAALKLSHAIRRGTPEACYGVARASHNDCKTDAGAIGNVGSAAIWIALDRIRRSGRLRGGDRVLVLGAETSKFMYGGFLYIHADEPESTAC